MKIRSRVRSLIALGTLSLSLGLAPIHSSHADGFAQFTGVVKLACEAMLCLSSSAGGGIAACNPALSYFYGIKEKYLSDTLAARFSFLMQCPTSAYSPQMTSLADAISKGVGRCDSKSLNMALGQEVYDGKGYWIRTSDRLPNYCGAYIQHEYTDLIDLMPVYVGTVENGGYWVAPEDYEAELAKYEAALEARLKAAQYYHHYW